MATPETAIQTRSTVTLTMVKDYLGVSGSTYDTYLTLVLAAAKKAADDFCNNPFHTAAGVDYAIPSPIELGILSYCKVEWEVRFASTGGGLSGRKAGDLTEWYATSATNTTVAQQEAYKKHWRPYRLPPGY